MAKNINQFSEFSDIHFAPGVSTARKTIFWWLPLLYLLISDAFYLRTYDSAQVKITLIQMGGISLIGLWLSLLLLEGRRAFRKEDFVFLSPFFVYLVYVIISFVHAPYKGPSVDDFVRYSLYMSVSLMVIREFTVNAIERLTKILIITAYIAVVYGFIQWLDINFFPPKNIGSGIDPFIWRGAFGSRIFSTYGNPNFFGNFLVLILPIIVSQYLKTKSVYLLPLVLLDLFCLYYTETKGAWLGFGISSCIFIIIYVYFLMREKFQANKLKFIGIALSIPLMAVLLVGYFAYKRWTSVSFRVATWLSTWEIVETHPFLGTGVGGFKVLYPAVRRPIIFHIEGKHNTETDHAENEHLEQWMDNGIVGFGLYLWLIAFVTVVGLRGLNSLVKNLKGSRPPPVAYDLLGYITALLGMLAHNFVDVSMRFVSSGVYLGLLPGIIINLARGHALWELHYKDEKPDLSADKSGASPSYNGFLWMLRISALALLCYACFLIIGEFSKLQGPRNLYMVGGDVLQWWIGWIVLLSVVVFLGYAFAKIILKGVSLSVPAAIILMLLPLYYFWGWFKADVYHNMAIAFSKQGKWEDAITYYRKVNRHNPYFIMPYYFTGNVFNDRFNMTKQYRPEWGDKNEVARDDFERAMEAYEQAREIAPNYVQMHHQVGLLYMKMHDYLSRQGKTREAQEFLDKALARFNLYENLDPVFPYNYYRRAQIHIVRKELEKAEQEYLKHLKAGKCYREKEKHMHESPEAYTNLANVRFVMGKTREAMEAYQRALELDPNFEPARRNYEALKQKYGVHPVKLAPTASPAERDFTGVNILKVETSK
ncbi:MAG: tetratricopeptide repeat protein [Elusimicrobia bacterium]|nr:tetratricopeptide repeat protein [Elusimicrobiota bacterium]